MQAFGVLLTFASIIIAFFIARWTYRLNTKKKPEAKARNIFSAIGTYILSVIVLVIIAAFIGISGAPESDNKAEVAKTDVEPKKEYPRQIGEAKTYSIIAQEDKSKRADNRVSSIWIMSPEAISFEDRAATVRKAAEDLQAKTNVPVIRAYLAFSKESVGRGGPLAMATYFADGCQYSGKECDDVIWDIQSSKDTVTPQQIKIYDTWYQNRKKFTDKNDNVNEDKLSNFVAKKLKIQPSEVTLVYVSLEKVNPYTSEEEEKSFTSKMKLLQDKVKERAKAIETQFSAWDGSHKDLTRRIKDAMNDPDSYKHYKTVYYDQGDHLTVITEYGGRNGFGGMVRETISADYSIDGNLLKINK
ncbi:hypothetical protein ACOZB2_23275 [Pantoea endophytica]